VKVYRETAVVCQAQKCLHDVLVEDFLWNSLDGNVLKQRGKGRPLEDLLPQKMQIGGMRVQLSTQTHPPF